MRNDEGSSTQPPLTDAYSTGYLNKDLPSELARLRLLERWADPTSISAIEKRGIRPNWRCLEMGAGAGSMAYWLAERCPQGRVIAADIDPRYLDPERAPNLEIARFDLLRDDFPKASFDLIHTRMVLSHLPERDEILKRALEWVVPGGVVVIEDYYVQPLDQMTEGTTRTVFQAMHRAFSAQGTNTHWTRKIPERLTALGVRNLQLSMAPMTVGMGHPSEELWRVGFEQSFPIMLARGFITQKEIDAYRALDKPDAVDFPWFLLSVSGLR